MDENERAGAVGGRDCGPTLMESVARYTHVAIVLHWLIALGVSAQIALGLSMITIPKSPPGVRAYWFNVHKSIGITLALFIVFRVLWRLWHRPPELPGSMPRWQRVAARVSHWSLYACLVVMPLSGYLGSSFTRYPILYFGRPLPHWGYDAPALKALMSDVHLVTATILIGLVSVHVAAALKHLLVVRDGVFGRMWFARRSAFRGNSALQPFRSGSLRSTRADIPGQSGL